MILRFVSPVNFVLIFLSTPASVSRDFRRSISSRTISKFIPIADSRDEQDLAAAGQYRVSFSDLMTPQKFTLPRPAFAMVSLLSDMLSPNVFGEEAKYHPQKLAADVVESEQPTPK